MSKTCSFLRFLLYTLCACVALLNVSDSYAATCSDENGEILFPAGAVTVPSAQELYNNGVIKAVNTSQNNEIYDLDAYVAGEEWSVYFPESNKIISGVAVCGPSGKAKNIAGQSSNAYISTAYPTNPPVAYLGCFCKLGGINDDTNYASAGQMGGSGSTPEAKLNNCRANCPSVCANYIATDAAFRAAIYGGADNCPVGTPGEGGGSEPETCDKTATDFCDVNAGCEYVLNNEYSVGYTMDVSDDYCYATPNQYTISLSLDGTNISDTISVYYDIEISDLPTPTMDGKSFQGWFDGNGNQYSNGMVYNVAGDITLYAQWGRDCEFPVGDAISQTPSADTSLSLPTVATLASQNPSDFTYSGGVYRFTDGGNGMAIYNADQRFSVKYENGLLWGTAFCGPNGSGEKTQLYYTNDNKGLTAYQAGKGCWCRYGLDNDKVTDFPWERASTMADTDTCRATCPSVCANYTATDAKFRSILLNEGEESGTCPVMDNSVQCEEQDGYDAAYNESTGECEYTPRKYTITLDSGEEVYVDIESIVEQVTVPHKASYRFGGYYTGQSATGTMIYDENGYLVLETDEEKLNYLLKNQMLYANWIEAFCTDDDGMVVWNSVDSIMDTQALLNSGIVSKKEGGAENVYQINDFAAYTADQRWAVNFPEYGTVTGSAFCGPRGSKAPGEAVSDVLTGNSGATVAQAYSGCYCRYGEPAPDQPWVKAADYYSSGDDWATRTDACRMNCSAKCANIIAGSDEEYSTEDSKNFRITLYGGADNCPVGSNDPILCAPGWYMDNGTCIVCPDGYTSDAGATAQNQCYQSCPPSACPAPDVCSDPNATCEYEEVLTIGKQYYGDTACVGATCDVNVTIICNDGYKLVDGTCQKQCTDNEMLVNGTCVEPEFTITTTDTASRFSFDLSAAGIYWIDWGDGTEIEKIEKQDTETVRFSHVFITDGAHTIGIYGDATEYSNSGSVIKFATESIPVSSSGGATLQPMKGNKSIVKFGGSLGAIFSGADNFSGFCQNCVELTEIPATLFNGVSDNAYFYGAFSKCEKLQSIPYGLFAGITNAKSNQFNSTFSGCTSLESIPEDLFAGISGAAEYMFVSTFYNCTSLKHVPNGIFANISGSAEGMFAHTFAYCTLLESIPEKMFGNVSGVAPRIFDYTFMDCTSLQSIPKDLFGDVSGGEDEMFRHTFSGCTSLKSIPENLFVKIIDPGYGMFMGTFSDCTSLESIPENLFANMTGIDGEMFSGTFYNCTNLSGYVPANMFKTLVDNGTGDLYAQGYLEDISQMDEIFYNTALDTSCPAGTTQYITGFESAWDGRVACAPCPDGVCSIVTQCSDGNAFGETTCYFDANTGDYTTCDMCEYTSCMDGFEMVDGACEFAPEFAVVTTPISGGTEFSFTLSAKGTYYIDWGDNTGIQSIQKTNVEPQVIRHTYENSADSYTIQMSGAATSYNTTEEPVIDFKGNEYVYELQGSLGAIFGGNAKFMFEHTFQDCKNLEIVPAALFNGVAGPDKSMFNSTFQGCEKLAEIPSGLFDILGDEYYDAPQQMFMGTFKDCSALNNVPSDLFAKVTGGAYGLFKDTFKNCSSLDSVHPELFVNITTPNANMFESTFQGCTSLTQIPAQLFQNVSGGAAYMFYSTFRNCSGLTSLESGLFDSINTNAPYMFDRTFLGCTSLADIPDDLFSGITTTDNASFMFIGTFNGCTGLKRLPSTLFANIQGVPADSMFDQTFRGCSGLRGYLPPYFFGGLDMTDVKVSSVMDETFTNTELDKKCPSGAHRTQANFGYTLSGRAVCLPCEDGTMSFAGANMCHVPKKLRISDDDTTDITVYLLPEKPVATLGMAFDIPDSGVYYSCLSTDENRTINNDTDKKMHIEYQNQHYLMYDCTAQ